MNNNRSELEITLKILSELTDEPLITQRRLADKLGIAVGLVNAYIKRLYKKGYIELKNLSKNRVKYIVTLKGFTEKLRITYKYMQTFIDYFKDRSWVL